MGNCFSAPVADSNGQLHWAFQSLRPRPVPNVKNTDWPRTAIDHFILAQLERQNLQPAPHADPLTLLRRASCDLIGLPPSPEESQAFFDDKRPEAYERLLDRLLASPRFGEKWGRHWLDAAGYVDVLGGDNDAGIIKLGRGKWRYRDYVVISFNHDKPFDRFLLEQLAGDELVDWRNAPEFTSSILELLTATTFLRCAADDTDENELNTPDLRHGVLQHTAEIVANNLLALTVNCAKCHDHKYDPIPQRDYYRFEAYFAPAFNPENWVQPTNRNLPDIALPRKADIDRHNQSVDEQIAKAKARREKIEAETKDILFEEKLARLPETIRVEVKTAIRTVAAQRTDAQKELARDHEKTLNPKPEEIAARLSDDQKANIRKVETEIAKLNRSRKTYGIVHGVYDVGTPPRTRILIRGDYLKPGDEVAPGMFRALTQDAAEDGSTNLPAKQGSTSGWRLDLARRLTASGTPAAALVARVQVNRIWQQLFGVGLVETSDNFGVNGARPTHPELLDWLAGEFVHGGWRIKPILRTIMNSAVYRQASSTPDSPHVARAMKIDPGNQWLWHQRLRRLDSEGIRDALLAVCGHLNSAMGGPAIPIQSRPDGSAVINERECTASDASRRSLYLLQRRNYNYSFLAAFDQPVMALNCTRRFSSAVVSQSLTMLNDSFVTSASEKMADRILRMTHGPESSNPRAEVSLSFVLALSRKPAKEEAQWCAALLQRQVQRHLAKGVNAEESHRMALANVCHVVLNTSEFLCIP